MRLSAAQSDLLDGRGGEAAATAIRMLAAVGRALDADVLIPIASAHIVLDAFAMGRPGADLIASFRRDGARFVAPTTINAISFDRRQTGADSEHDACQRRMLEDCVAMGALATCSCNPFNQGIAPVFGEHLAWSESATTAYVNSVLGARTNREGATAIASALTGLTPRYGMHLGANRMATVHFEVDAAPADDSGYNLLGALIARRSGSRIPAITMATRPGVDDLQGFSASFAIVANLPMFHLVGVTPEAPTLAAACGGLDVPTQPITFEDIEEERRRHDTATGTRIDLVTIGAPHASLGQIRAVAEALGDRRVVDGVAFTLTTNRSNLALAEGCGLLERLTAAGVTVTADRMCFGCDLGAPHYGRQTTLATNSVKAAMSAPGTRGVDVHYGTVEQCVDAAVTGTWKERTQP